jgi:hypothetical protein
VTRTAHYMHGLQLTTPNYTDSSRATWLCLCGVGAERHQQWLCAQQVSEGHVLLVDLARMVGWHFEGACSLGGVCNSQQRVALLLVAVHGLDRYPAANAGACATWTINPCTTDAVEMTARIHVLDGTLLRALCALQAAQHDNRVAAGSYPISLLAVGQVTQCVCQGPALSFQCCFPSLGNQHCRQYSEGNARMNRSARI